ncbi:MAG: ERAP1-like C-terminal domain-containing protein [Bradymonadia bacterium]
MSPSRLFCLCTLLAGCMERPPPPPPDPPAPPAIPEFDGAERPSEDLRPQAWALTLQLAEQGPLEGRAEFSLHLKQPTQLIPMHGGTLQVTRLQAEGEWGQRTGRFQSMPHDGLALWFDTPLPPGPVKLTVEYTADFGLGAPGLWRTSALGGIWSGLASSLGRHYTPGFDVHGFEAPLTLKVKHPEGWRVIGAGAPHSSPEPGITLLQQPAAIPSDIRWVAGPFESVTCGGGVVLFAPGSVKAETAALARQLTTWSKKVQSLPLEATEAPLQVVLVPGWGLPTSTAQGLVIAALDDERLTNPLHAGDQLSDAYCHQRGISPEADTLDGTLIHDHADTVLDVLHPAHEPHLLRRQRASMAMGLGPLDPHPPVRWWSILDTVRHLVGKQRFETLGSQWLAHRGGDVAQWFAAIDTSTRQPLSGLLGGLVSAAEPPRVNYAVRCGARASAPAQVQLSPASGAEIPNGLPLCMHVGLDGASTEHCLRWSAETHTIELPRCPTWLAPDTLHNHHWQMAPALTLDVINRHWDQLSVSQRISMPGALIGQLRHGHLDGHQFLEALAALSAKHHPLVLEGVADGVHLLARLTPDPAMATQLAHWARRHVAPSVVARRQQGRPHLALSTALVDLKALTPAELCPEGWSGISPQLAEVTTGAGGLSEADVRSIALCTLGATADQHRALVAAFEAAADAHSRSGLLMALGHVASPELIEATLRFSQSGDLLDEEREALWAQLARRPQTASQLRGHLEGAPSASSGPAPILTLAAGLCAPDDAARIEAWCAALPGDAHSRACHRLSGAARACAALAVERRGLADALKGG